MTTPLVSISCITYNHAPYIRECLEGFLMQKTNFPFEILIHDDASTDGTADIIREYEAKYPELIKPIFREKNLYSQGVRGMNRFNFERAQGKYIALCEGDDFWTDPNKLQIQFDFMESHPDYSMCFHNALFWNYETGDRSESHYCGSDATITLDDMLKYYLENVVTHTVFLRRKCLNKLSVFSENISVGDVPIQLCAATSGKVFYNSRVMGCYRWRTPGSWTWRCDKKKFVESRKEICRYLKLLAGRGLIPPQLIRSRIRSAKFTIYWLESRYIEILFDFDCLCYLLSRRFCTMISLILQMFYLKPRTFLKEWK